MVNINLDKLFVCDKKNNLIRIDDKFYTEDNILIFTLYVANIPANTDSDVLKEYFSKFGKVENVVYKKNYKTKDGERVTSIVRFVEAESASKALRKQVHKIESKRLVVRGADSWIQPHKFRLEPIQKIDDNESENYYLLKLNDDCLFNIFSYLKLNDQIRLALLSERLKKIFQLYYKNCKTLYIDYISLDHLTLMEIKEGFSQIGKLIEKLSVNCMILKFNRIYDFILKFFPNLKSLKMQHLSIHYKDSNKEIPQAFKKLLHLELIACHVTDDHLKKFTKLRRLETLNLSDNPSLTGKQLHNFINLKTLILSHCLDFEVITTKPIFENIKLKKLNVFGIPAMDMGMVYEKLVEIGVNLEEYHLSSYKSDNTNLKLIPKIRNLKRIRLSFALLNKEDIGLKIFLESCVEHKSEQLEYLGLIGKDLYLTKDNISSIVQLKNLKELEIIRLRDADCMFWTKLNYLDKLKSLKFEYPMEEFDESAFLSWLKKAKNIESIQAIFSKYKIKNDFIYAAIDLLKEKSIDKRIHLDLTGVALVIDDGITNGNILEDPKYLTNRKLIKINLKSPPNTDDDDHELFSDISSENDVESNEDIDSDDFIEEE